MISLNRALNKRRLPVEGDGQEAAAEGFSLDWPYNADFEAMVEGIFSQARGQPTPSYRMKVFAQWLGD